MSANETPSEKQEQTNSELKILNLIAKNTILKQKVELLTAKVESLTSEVNYLLSQFTQFQKHPERFLKVGESITDDIKD